MKRKIFGIFFLVFILAVTLITATSCDGLIGGNDPSGGKVDIEGEHEHEWGEYEVLQEPDCQNMGVEARYCQCGEEDRAAIPTIPHTYGEWITTIEPDCQDEGERYRRCIYCNNLDSERIKRTEHTVVYYPETAPTCQSEGTTKRAFCSVCGENIVIGETIPKLPHTYTAEVFLPTCEEKGYTTYTCECGDSYKDNYVDALGHQEVTDAALPPTCEESGLTEGSHCARCEITLVAQRYVPPTRHSYSQWIIEVEPTCTAQGLKYRECTTCSITLDTRLIPELGHKVEYIPEKAATCEEDGLTAGEYCSVCQAVILAQAPIPPKGHSYDTVITEPSCTEGGYSTHTCKCGNEYVDGYTNPHGHSEVTDEALLPTCTENGLTEGSHCGICNEVFTSQESIPAIGHSYYTANTESTCTTQGYTTHICERCGDSYKDTYLPTIPHSYVSEVTEPTCTEEGYTTYTCSGCGDSYKTGYVNAIGHSFGEWTTIDGFTVRNCENGRGCEEYQRISSVKATYVGPLLLTGEYVLERHIQLTATLSDGTTIDITDFTLENDLITKEGTNIVTVKFGGYSINVSVSAILDNLPETTSVFEFTYTVKNGEITITKFNGNSTNVVIPAHIDRVPVRAIQSEAFMNNSVIQSVTIPGSIRTINPRAFYCCYGLTTVTLNEGLETIGGRAFSECPIRSIVIPDTVTKINTQSSSGAHYGAFQNCTLLETVIIGDSLSVIQERTFSGCSALKNLVIGKSVTEIGNSAFYECDSLVDLDIPDSVTKIAHSAFKNCGALKNVSIGEGVTLIESCAFQYCTSIENIYIPGSVQELGYYAFYGCAGLTDITFSEGLKIIGGGAFYGCPVISIVIPDSVLEIDYHTDVTAHDGAFENCKHLVEVVLGNGLTAISASTFEGCSALTDVSFGDSVSYIDTYAFHDCDSLEYIAIGDSVNLIDNYAFKDCDKLKNIDFGSGVTKIGIEAFRDCTSINTLYIPGNVQSIGRSAFYGCVGLTDLTFSEGLKTIGGEAFYGCPIRYLVIPDSVVEIDYYISVTVNYGAFENCKKLESIIIGDGLTTIEKDTFRGCTSLKHVEMGAYVQKVSAYAFAECTSLTRIEFPNSLVTIDEHAFADCTLLDDIIFGSGVQTIGEYAFAGCTSLRSMAIPLNVQVIERNAFSDCTELREITLEKGRLHTIGKNVFEGCNKFKRIYYTGTEADWNSISMTTPNPYPLTATPFFYSKSAPSVEGNFWFSDRNGKSVAWNVDEEEFRADLYNDDFLEKFSNILDSYSYQLYRGIADDEGFVASFAAWTTIQIIINPFEQIKQSISKKEFYEIAIFDVLMLSNDGSSPMEQMYNQQTDRYIKEIRDHFYHGQSDRELEIIEFLFDVKELDKLDAFTGISSEVLEGVGLLLDASENAYDAINAVSRYIALQNLSDNFELILMDVYNNKDNPSDLRNAAKDSIKYFQLGFEEMMDAIGKGYWLDIAETSIDFAADAAWGALLNACGLGTVQVIAQGIAFLMDDTLNMDAAVAAYYQLDSAINLEASIRRIAIERLDYLRYENAGDVDKYNDTITLYKNSMLKNYDYCEIFFKACKTDDVNTSDIITEKAKLEVGFNDFEHTIDYNYDLYLEKVQ